MAQSENRVAQTGREWIMTRPTPPPTNKPLGNPPTAEALEYYQVRRYRRSTMWRTYEDVVRSEHPDFDALDQFEERFPGIRKDAQAEWAAKNPKKNDEN